jgi:hypothetical protein
MKKNKTKTHHNMCKTHKTIQSNHNENVIPTTRLWSGITSIRYIHSQKTGKLKNAIGENKAKGLNRIAKIV